MKQYVGIARDHSGSMSSLRQAAIKDYNDTIRVVKEASTDNGIDTIASTVRFGIAGAVDREIVNSNVSQLKPITTYRTDGMTPLFDAVGELIEIFEKTPDQSKQDVTFLVMAITDGQENVSRKWRNKLGDKIRELQATDRWTFVFRVPRGYSQNLENLGIPSGNIQEWDQTERGLRESSVVTQSAISNYYSGVSRGIRSSTGFYTNLAGVSQNKVTSVMTNISGEVRIFPVDSVHKVFISSFFSLKTHQSYKKGTAFYQLTKPEKAVQGYKLIVVRNKNTGAVYAGQSARDLLHLPTVGTIRLAPGDHGDWDIYIQSTSSNRILIPGTTALYWEGWQK
jgi:hypothetical protein